MGSINLWSLEQTYANCRIFAIVFQSLPVLLCLTVYCGDILLCWRSVFIMSHSLLWRHIVLLTVGVYSSNYRVLYTIGISMTRRFQKSVGPSLCPFVTLTKKAYSSFIIDSRKIIRTSGERAYHPLHENEEIFFTNFRANFEKFGTCIKCPPLLRYKQ